VGPPGRPDPTRATRRWPWLVALAILIGVAVVVRVATLKPPDVVLHARLPTTVRLSGSAPTPVWPASGQAALVVDGLGSLGTAGGDTPAPTASLAKVMTAYLTLLKYPLSQSGGGFTLMVTAADARAEAQDVKQDESVVAVRAGQQLDERQLLEALLIPSGDNIAQMLAAYDAGSVSRFVAEMNSTARALGMNRTTYTDPSGFDPSTVSDASDQLRVLQRAMRFAAFRQIVSMSSATLPVAGTVENYDPLIPEGYYGKTGSDSAAEGCLAFFKYVTVDGRRLTLVGVVMGQGYGSTTSVVLGAAAVAAERLVGSVMPALRAHTVVPAHTTVMVATSADGHRVAVVTSDPLTVIGWGGMRERLAIRSRRPGIDLSPGQRLGEAQLAGPLPTSPGQPTQSAIRVVKKLAAPGISWRLQHLF